jgi:hypothetical protein
MTKDKAPLDQPSSQGNRGEKPIPLGRQNYLIMLLGVIVIVIGFILMSGGKYTDPSVFNPEELYSARRITVAPIVVLIGFAIEVYAIFHRSVNND